MKVLALAVVVLLGVTFAEGRAIRDLKSDLIAKGQSLIKQADEAVQKLNGVQKVAEAAIVKTEEARIKALIAELETATTVGLTRLEGELRQAEQKLQFEILKIEREAKPAVPVVPIVTRDLKSDLIAKGNKLVAEADAAFKKLSTAQKAAEAAVVKAEEAAVKKFIAELEAATDEAAIKKIEAELNVAEKKLAVEVAKIEKEVVAPVIKTPVTQPIIIKTQPIATRDLKADLIAKGQKLVAEADSAFKKLTTAQKAAEAAVVKSEEAAVKKFIAELEAATDEAALKKIEAELNVAEKKLAAEVAKIEKEVVPVVVPPKPVTRDLKSDLIARGAALIKQADEAVQKLTGQAKVAEAAIVKAEEDAIRKLTTELEATTEEPALRRIEGELSRAEQKLAQEIAKINQTATPTGDLKKTLIAKGQDLIKQADAAVQTLTGAQKVAEAAIVRAEEGAIRRLITELEAATEESAVRRIEAELTRAEQRLAAEVAKITKTPVAVDPVVPVPTGLKATLIARGESLIKQADEAVQKLRGQAKVAEAAIVKAEEDAIRKLTTELEAATDDAAIRRIEGELNRAEQKLAQEIAKINRLPVAVPIVARDLKSDLITKGQNLIKQADEAVQKLNGAQKVQEAAIVKTEEARIKALIAELETATTLGVTRIEGELSRAEQKLSFEIQKIEREAKPVVPVVPIVTRDLKSDLIAKGNKLVQEATSAFSKLTTAQKAAEAAVVKAEEAAVKKFIAELEAATDEAALKKIEAELNVAEKKLAAEVAKLEKEVAPKPNPVF